MARSGMWLAAAMAVLGAAACGGTEKGAAPPSDPEVADGEAQPEADEGANPNMVAPERMDEIKALLDRKRTIVARCLPDAIEAGKAQKNARGRVTLEFVITRQGKARGLKVAEATLESEMVQECTMNHVANIDFGALPRDLEWSYTYSFEAY